MTKNKKEEQKIRKKGTLYPYRKVLKNSALFILQDKSKIIKQKKAKIAIEAI
jgi:hypothetical protein